MKTKNALQRTRAVMLIRPCQCGQMTLARQIVSPASPNDFDPENPIGLARSDEPMKALQGLRGIMAIDEVPPDPNLFPILRVPTDRKPLPARFLVMGSASPDLLCQSPNHVPGAIR